ncbi:BZ3500_MvSof-1268-A1-R1_Chr4-3g07314 [Microbotryum saponariae]|uniref:BZ3500_MvSof-1268-A1-R1_Chr4-3g07314 protein n=1 Tax=Microbotryum saponariae TaxID=289078 RepID=A0A2X0NMK5_9BASI|nr:BZ3500_MvSof-1268-A1-R1_Chr4-3g07314 [Microbotryum saponariae]SDA06977.1 BZ3501_MvSof-1269-A2-R1_Chr4-2g07023 [Microbotryum saponariae]
MATASAAAATAAAAAGAFTSSAQRMYTLHSRPIASPTTCKAAYQHDSTTQILSTLIIVGLIASYLPQHFRIIHHKTSDGFSPFFLLLGSTSRHAHTLGSPASSLLNIVTLQWGQVACCQYLSAGQCFESILGIGQVFFQCFILYLIYFPRSQKYIRTVPLETNAIPAERPWSDHLIPSFMRTSTPRDLIRSRSRSSSMSSRSAASTNSSFDPRSMLLPGQVAKSSIILAPEYRRAVSLFALTMLHLALTLLTTVILLVTLPKAPHEGSPPAFPGGGREHPSERAVRVWATTLGLVAVVLGCGQYLPQLVLTARKQLVGSLSIPMMWLQVSDLVPFFFGVSGPRLIPFCSQTPGSFVFVYTLAVRPGVNWSGWATYLITGILQGALLVLCLCWKARQNRLGIDDWGNKVEDPTSTEGGATGAGREESPTEHTRLLR